MLPTTLLNGLSAVLLFAFPIFSLFHQSVPGAVLHILASIGLIRVVYLACNTERRAQLKSFWAQYGILCLAMASPFVVNLVSTLSVGAVENAYPSTLQRLAMAGFVLVALSRLPLRLSAVFQWGVIVAALTSSIVLYKASHGGTIRPDVDAQNLLNYTNFIVLLGVYSLYMLNWRLSRYPVAESLTKVAAFASAFYAIWLSESRGPTLSLAILLILFALFGLHRIALRWRIASCIAMLALVLMAGLQSDRLTTRIETAAEAVRTTLPAIMNGGHAATGDASTRVRLELWYASWLMLKETPWLGDGSRSFSERLVELNRAGHISDGSTWKVPDQEAYTQPHNEFANALAVRGAAGGAALLLLYGVPLWYFITRRRKAGALGCIASDMGIATCTGAVLFGLTVSVFTSGWISALYVLLIMIFISLSQNDSSNGTSDTSDDTSIGTGPIKVPSPSARKIFKELYLLGHGRRRRHNSHLWPYVRVSRNTEGAVNGISVFNRAIPIVPVSEAFAHAGPEFHIILSGGSVADIDYSRLPALQAIGVNGSIALKDRFDIDFPYYCVIDRSFARTQRHLMERIVAEDRVFLLSPDVLRYVLETIPIESIRCRFCIIEDIKERAYQPRPTPASLLAMQAQGADIAIFDKQLPLGFSFDPSAGWFDADTVAYTALQAVVWGGAQRVYFHGLDIKGAESTPRFYETQGARPSTRLEQNFRQYIEPSFREAIPRLRARGVNVYNLSPISALGPDIIPFVDWRELCDRP